MRVPVQISDIPKGDATAAWRTTKKVLNKHPRGVPFLGRASLFLPSCSLMLSFLFLFACVGCCTGCPRPDLVETLPHVY